MTSMLGRGAWSLGLVVLLGCGDDGSGSAETGESTGSTSSATSSAGTMQGTTAPSTTNDATTLDSDSIGEGSATVTSTTNGSDSATTSGATESTGAPTSSTGTSAGTGSTGTQSTGVTELGPYGDCVGEMLPCPDGAFCLLVPGSGVCALEGCTNDEDCPEPPPGGDAPAICLDANGDDVDDCRIDCSAGQTCPTGMECFSDEICVWS